MLRDLRHSFRVLLQSKGWTVIVLLSLGLGIGVNTTLFSAINSLMLRSLPAIQQPHELVRLGSVGENDMVNSTSTYGYTAPTPSGERTRSSFSFPVFEALKSANETLTGMVACAPIGRVNVIVDGNAELASGFVSTSNYFQVLGLGAVVGRTLTPGDDEADASPAAVISYRYWQRRFGGAAAVVGRVVNVNSLAVTIVGVTPPDYAGIHRLGESPPDIHLPVRLDPQLSGSDRLTEATHWWLPVFGRLKPGVTPAQVEGNLNGTFQASSQAGWDAYFAGLSDEDRGLERNRDRSDVASLNVSSGSRGLYDPRPDSARSLSILGVVVALVLLIVCANVASLLLSKAITRRKEISIRLSLGATRRRLVRQLLTESILLAIAGGVLAMVVAYWSRQLLPFGQEAPLDWRVFCFAGGLSALTGIVFGLLPALRATRLDLAQTMNETGRAVARSRTALGKALLVLQVAMSLVLLIGAGLFLRTLENLRHVDVGFNRHNLLLVRVNPEANRYDEDRSERLIVDLREEFAALPGVRSVSFSQVALLSGSTWNSTVHVEGGADGESAHILSVSPEFLDTYEIPLLTGRNVSSQDDDDAPRVALVNQAFARQFFEGQDPLGRRFGFSPETRSEIEIVGLVADARYSSVRDDAPPTVYQSYHQTRTRRVIYEVRTAVPPSSLIPAVRQAAARVDPHLPLGETSTQAEEVEGQFSQERLFALAYALFGGLALLLASIGLFGLMSYSVTSRTNEIGIRLALGAQRTGVIGMVLRESLLLVAIGAALGLAAALAAGRLVASLLYDVAPTDPLTIAGATLVLFLVAGLAGYLPARRASRVDPLRALHYE